MENEALGQKLKNVGNIEKSIHPSNINILINSYNNSNIEHTQKTQLKLGQYMLTPLEGLILNKKMPHGYKFETEENILKCLEVSKNTSKRLRLSEKLSDFPKHAKLIKNQLNEEKNSSNKDKEREREHQSNNNKKLKKALTNKENPIENIHNKMNNNSEAYKIMMKCYSAFNAPCLSMIEKKINNCEYKTVNDFCDDLRKFWNHQFKNHAKEPNIYQNICKMSLLSDQICKDINNEKINENQKEEISNIKKRTDKIKKDLNQIKVNNQTNEAYSRTIKRNLEEIKNLCQLIKTLTKEQLRGIIPIVCDKNENHKSKQFEFDLEQLPNETYKKLEEYVYNCKNSKGNKNNNKINKDTKSDNKNKTNYEGDIKDKLNTSKNDINNNDMNNKINNNKNININGTNKGTTQFNHNKKSEEKKIISDKKSFSESDSMSSLSSLSN